MAVRLLQLNRELHEEVKSVLEGSLTLDLHYLDNEFLQQTEPNEDSPVTLAPSLQYRLNGLRGIRITPGVYSLPSTYTILCGPLEAPPGTDTFCIPKLLDWLAANAVGRPLDLGLEMIVPEFCPETVITVMQEHTADLEQYCAFHWRVDLWCKLLGFMGQGAIREVAVCFVSATGFFGELIKLQGVGHVLGPTFEFNEHRARLEVLVEYDEEHMVKPCERKSVGRHLHHEDDTEETMVRLRLRKGRGEPRQ